MKARLYTALALVAFAGPVFACGLSDFFGYVYNGGEARVFAVPRTSFGTELLRLLEIEWPPSSGPYVKPPTDWEATLEADLRDLTVAVADMPVQERLVRRDRPMLFKLLLGPFEERVRFAGGDVLAGYERLRGEAAAGWLPEHAMIASLLPQEFALYARGAAHYHAGEFEQAAGRWEALLNLPEPERQYRSVWAAFMLGKLHLKNESAEQALPWFERTRELAAAGCVDSLGLAFESLGWQALAEIRLGQYRNAIHLYVAQIDSNPEGGRYAPLQSLDYCGTLLLQAETLDPEWITDPLVQKVIAAELTSTHRTDYGPKVNAWLDALLQANAAPDPTLAGHIALGLYRMGEIEGARRWIAYADKKCSHANWVRAKLLLYDGKIEEALALLRVLRYEFSAHPSDLNYRHEQPTLTPEQLVQGEAGLLLMSQQRYVEALDAFMRGSMWADAAYVAENVLTVEELARYVLDTEGEFERQNIYGGYSSPGILEHDLRQLLARRYLRAGQLEPAVPLFPSTGDNLFPSLVQRYTQAVRIGENRDLAPDARASGYFDAAGIAREYGVHLLATELEPDWAIDGCNYILRGPSEQRLIRKSDNGHMFDDSYPDPPPEVLQRLLASDDEIARATESMVRPMFRFHYRHVAADYAWQAAQLLPDNHPLLARALYNGGIYIENTDPQAADPFYKALVLRCWGLPISAVADKERWFPEPPVFDQLMAGVTAPVFPAEASPLGAWVYDQLGPRVYRKAGWLQQHWPLPVKEPDSSPPTQEPKDFFVHLIQRVLERQPSP